MDTEWKNKKMLILGMGISGEAARDFLLRRGATVTEYDDRFSNPNTVELTSYDGVIVSPGVPPTHPIYRSAENDGIPIIGEAELALRSSSHPVIGITGTNGKTTVTLLVEHLFNTNGIKAKAVGNIGNPLACEIDKHKNDSSILFVAELSSYQLETMTSRSLSSAAILNITPDHLDRYPSMEAYAAAKIQIGTCLQDGGVLVVSERVLDTYRERLTPFTLFSYGFHPDSTCFSDGDKIYFKKQVELILPDPYREKFDHDMENCLAAYLICRLHGVAPEQFKEAITTFKKPPHRLEFVKYIDHVAYYNDSKGTNVDAVVRAVEAMLGTTILIAGGVHKGASYSPWKDCFSGKVRHICAIGEAKKTIFEELSAVIPVETFATLEEAVIAAKKLAKPGENVLFSPGCSSFDMFKNYSHRGDVFKEIVHLLSERSYS